MGLSLPAEKTPSKYGSLNSLPSLLSRPGGQYRLLWHHHALSFSSAGLWGVVQHECQLLHPRRKRERTPENLLSEPRNITEQTPAPLTAYGGLRDYCH